MQSTLNQPLAAFDPDKPRNASVGPCRGPLVGAVLNATGSWMDRA